MALNVAALLGGLSSGYRQARQERRQDEREQLAELRANQAQANTMFNQIQELTRQDALDEANTLQQLRTAGLDPAMRQAIINQRKMRSESAKSTIGSLGTQPGIKQQYGDVSGLLAPSMLTQPGFEVKPYMSEEGLRAIAERAGKEATLAAKDSKPAIIERARQDLLQYAPKEYVDKILPVVGGSLGFGAPTAAKPLDRPQDIGKLTANFPDFKPGIGGTRVLPTGAKQRIYYTPEGKPVVDYQKAMTADYVSPEGVNLKNARMAEDLRQLRGMYDYKVQKAKADVEYRGWQSKLLKEQVAMFPETKRAEIKAKLGKLSNTAADTNAKLRLLSILLSAEQRQQALNLDERQFGLNVASEISRTQNGIRDDIARLEADRRSLIEGIGDKRDLGRKGGWTARQGLVSQIDKEIAGLKQRAGQIFGGNLSAASSMLGGGFGDINAIDPTALLTGQAGQADLMQRMMMMRMMQPQQPVMPQAPIVIGGQQSPQVDPNLMIGAMMALAGGRGGAMPGMAGPGGGPVAAPGVLRPGTLGGFETLTPDQQTARLEQLKKAYPRLASTPQGMSKLQFFSAYSQLEPLSKANLQRQEAEAARRR